MLKNWEHHLKFLKMQLKYTGANKEPPVILIQQSKQWTHIKNLCSQIRRTMIADTSKK